MAARGSRAAIAAKTSASSAGVMRSVLMAMVQVGEMRMAVPQRLVHVLVGVRLRPFVAGVCVPMMLVVRVAVGMHNALVSVLVLVLLGEHEPGGDHHQPRGK